MATVFAGWLNKNETRNYPLHDYASKQGVDGTLLPDGILVDANILVPESAGSYIFISSLAITPGLISLTFLATNNDPFGPVTSSSSSDDFVPLAAIVVQRPVTLYRNYAIDAIYPGVAGWVAFGSDVEETDTLSLRFTSASDALLVPKAVRPYKDYPANSLAKFGRVTELTGLVQLYAGSDVLIQKGVRTINGRKKEVITVGLDLTSSAAEILRNYAGDCGERPEDRTCSRGKPILSINGVTPDCSGNVDIIFQGLDASLASVEGGVVVDIPIGLDDVCPTFDPARYDPVDLCETPPSSSSESPEPPSSSSSSETPTPPTPPPEEYFDDFSDAVRTFTYMIPQEGVWHIADVEPSEAVVGRSRLFGIGSAQATIIVPIIYKRQDPGYQTFAVIRPYTSDANGHVIFGYKGIDDYWYAGVSINTEDATTGLLYVGHKTGDLGSALDNWPNGLEYGYQFDSSGGPDTEAGAGIISATGIFDSDIRVLVRIEPADSIGELSLVKVEWYWNRSGQGYPNPTTPFNTTKFTTGFDVSGACGVGAVDCETHFDSFGIFNL